MRILGIDYGDSRTGIAVSDPFGLTAQPITVISEKNAERLLEKICKIISEYAVEKIVIGLPKNMNGTVGERGERTKEFAQMLREKTALPVIEWDERLTTASAHRTLSEANVSGKKRRGILDKIAAVFILQGYLDSQANKF